MYTRIRTTLQILSILASLFSLNAAVLIARYRSSTILSSVNALVVAVEQKASELTVISQELAYTA